MATHAIMYNNITYEWKYLISASTPRWVMASYPQHCRLKLICLMEEKKPPAPTLRGAHSFLLQKTWNPSSHRCRRGRDQEPQSVRHQQPAWNTNWRLSRSLSDGCRCVWGCRTSGSLKYMSRLWSRVNQRFLKPSVCCGDKQVDRSSQTRGDGRRRQGEEELHTDTKQHCTCAKGGTCLVFLMEKWFTLWS